MKKRRNIILAVAIIFCGLAIALWDLSNDPRVVMLSADGPAHWIRAESRLRFDARRDRLTQSTFTTEFLNNKSDGPIVMHVAALRRVVIAVDNQQIFDSGPKLDKWKTIFSVPIPSNLPGKLHQLRCVVWNEYGPDLLRIRCPELGIYTNQKWQAAIGNSTLQPAIEAEQFWDPVVPPEHRPSVPGIFVLPIFLGVAAFIGILHAKTRPTVANWPSRLRWTLLALWGVLGINNLVKIPLDCGYDAPDHYQYILYIFEHWELPAPDAGWQYFQSPLYYIISAAFCRLLVNLSQNSVEIMHLLRCVPLLCGALILQLSYRIGRAIYPMRADLQMITTLVGGWVPVNFYMSQTVSNGPMVSAVGALILLMGLRFIIKPQNNAFLRSVFLAGITLGIGWITKISALVWAGPLAAAIVFALIHQKKNWTVWIKAAAAFAASTFAVSGWLFIRNYHLVGKLFFRESTVADSPWWQDPGYRTPGALYEFGHVFTDPTHHMMSSIWDSLYATWWGTGVPSGPMYWNFALVSCGAWLAIVPASAVVLGMIRSTYAASLAEIRPALFWAVFTVGCFIAAILYVYLTLPIYSCARAAYMLGATPCIGMLAAAGLEQLTKNRWWRAGIGGMLVCWMVTVYLSFWA